MSGNWEKYFEVNRALWNGKTKIHMDSSFYDVEAFRAGKSSLNPAELEALGEVSGKSLLHLQCHFGMDSLSWARLGAQVTAVDFSGEAITAAEGLRDELGLEARFIHANIYDLPQHLDEQFDIVFTSYGAIPWLPDLDQWAQLIRRYLKPGGTFLIVEFHPVLMMLDFDSLGVDYSYFNTGKPYFEEVEGTYAVPDADFSHGEYFWNHSLSEIFGALMGAGLQLEEFKEYPYSYYDCYPNLIEVDPGRYAFKGKEGILPLMFSSKWET